MTARTERMIEAYREQFRMHGASPAALLCPKGRQDIRFANLHQHLPDGPFSVLDFGCGLGHLFDNLASQYTEFDYHGVDLVPDFIAHCADQKDSRARFDLVDSSWLPDRSYDFIFISGTFNIRTHEDADASRRAALTKIAALFRSTRAALVCDFMTTLVDFQQPDAQHFDPDEVARFAARELSRRFIVLHHYLPYEFALVAFRNTEIQRPENVYAR